MKIHLNGKPYENENVATVASLLEELEIRGRRVAVMLNDEIVKKSDYGERRLNDGDRVEIVQMVGGG